MTTYTLSLHHDRIPPGGIAHYAPGFYRVLYCRSGAVQISGQSAEMHCDQAILNQDVFSATGSVDGALLWRFELRKEGESAPQPAGYVETTELTTAPVELDSPHGYLMRCDAVNFPLGCEIFEHTHGGGGIRCIRSGALSLTIGGKDQSFHCDEGWFESGEEPVCGVASTEKMTGFIRVMILPRTYLGKSSIRYIREVDWEKPKRQTYRTFIDTFIDLS